MFRPRISLLALALLMIAPLAVADENSNLFYFDSNDGAYLGVQIEEETEHDEGGARITHIVDDSPADRAGLREGDIVIRFGRDVVRGPASLTKKIRDREAGDTVELTVLRNGRREQISVELGEQKSFATAWTSNLGELSKLAEIEVPDIDMTEIQERLSGLKELEGIGDAEFFVAPLAETFGTTSVLADCDDDEEDCNFRFRLFTGNRPTLGVHLTELTADLRRHFGSDDETGVMVSKVVANSAAATAGIEVGDVIVDVDGDSISNTFDLRRALQDRAGETFDIRVLRNGRSRSISVTIEEPEETEGFFGPRAAIAPRPRAISIPRPSAAPDPRLVPMPAPRPAVPVAPRFPGRLLKDTI